MASRDSRKDCLACRLISGFGLIAMGAYIFSQSKNRKKIEMNTMRLISGSKLTHTHCLYVNLTLTAKYILLMF